MKPTQNFNEAMDYLKVSSTVLGELVTLGEIPAAKIGKSWVFRTVDLDKYLEQEISRQTAERAESPRATVKTAYSRRREKPVLPELDIAA
jgi:excisionase family DNA binding protein